MKENQSLLGSALRTSLLLSNDDRILCDDVSIEKIDSALIQRLYYAVNPITKDKYRLKRTVNDIER